MTDMAYFIHVFIEKVEKRTESMPTNTHDLFLRMTESYPRVKDIAVYCYIVVLIRYARGVNARLLLMFVTRHHAKHVLNYEYLTAARIMLSVLT